MLEDYFSKNVPIGVTQEQKQRLLAVQAALEIAKASVSGGDASASAKTDSELKYVAALVSPLADSIQESLKKL